MLRLSELRSVLKSWHGKNPLPREEESMIDLFDAPLVSQEELDAAVKEGQEAWRSLRDSTKHSVIRTGRKYR